jgi:hypothetical protein
MHGTALATPSPPICCHSAYRDSFTFILLCESSLVQKQLFSVSFAIVIIFISSGLYLLFYFVMGILVFRTTTVFQRSLISN